MSDNLDKSGAIVYTGSSFSNGNNLLPVSFLTGAVPNAARQERENGIFRRYGFEET